MARRTVKQTSKQVPNLSTNNYLSKIENDIKSNQSRLSMVLGGLIILIIGILVFNYFNKNKSSLGPAQQTEQPVIEQVDVSPENLPGKYTVKAGDTLFLIAEKYYNDGFKYEVIAKANNFTDVNSIEVGQVLEIPKLEDQLAMASQTPSPAASPETPVAQENQTELGTGGADTTIWGAKIEGDTYTVVEGDWLSTIAARAYGDIFSYNKIAEANNISNPDYIIPGQVLKIPR